MPPIIDRTEMIEQFIRQFTHLPVLRNAENLYDQSEPAGVARAANLKLYLNLMLVRQPTVLLVGEAPGYEGTRRTGIPFASESMIDGFMPEVPFLLVNQGSCVYITISEHIASQPQQ